MQTALDEGVPDGLESCAKHTAMLFAKPLICRTVCDRRVREARMPPERSRKTAGADERNA